MSKRVLANDYLTADEIKYMEECIGFDEKRVYHRSGNAYFKPYYNVCIGYSKVLEDMKKKGLMYSRGGCYQLTREGMIRLSNNKKVYIYSPGARGGVVDAQNDVIDILLEDLAYCGYGNWIPSSAKDIAKRARLPLKLTIDTLHYLRDKCGYVKNSYYGECDDEGNPYCVHGWSLTQKWIDENRERFDSAKKEESDRIDRLLWEF